MGPHAGSWNIFGLPTPDLGVTEFVGGLMGQGRNAQGGSDWAPNTPTNYASGGGANYNTPQGYTPPGMINNRPANQSNGGAVLGANTFSGGGGGSSPPTWQQQFPNAFSENNARDIANSQNALRNEISGGWDSYLSQLNDLANNGLTDQRTAQENIANSQYDQGINTLSGQKASTLKDIGNNIRSAFQAGNVYLGSRGAGDSSAANQYSFALNKQANKQTSDVNAQFNTAQQNLSFERDQKINQVAQWFGEMQNQIKQQIAQGGLGKSQDLANLSKDLLNRSLAQIDEINRETRARQSSLEEWAMSNSQNVGQLSANLARTAQPFQAPTIGSDGNLRAPVGFGGGNSSDENLKFQNPAWFS